MDATDNAVTLLDEQAVAHLFSEFSRCVDEGDAGGLSALFTSDGVLRVGDMEIRGQAAIGHDLVERARPPGRITRHIWSNLRILSKNGQSMQTAALQLTFEQSGPDKPTQLRISDLFDHLQREHDGKLRFVSRIIDRKMTGNFPA